MSDQQGHEALRQEQDHIESGTIVAVGVLALAIFGVGIFWAVQIQKDSNGTVRSYSPDQVPVGRRDEVGMVYQSSFENNFGAKLRAEQSDYLNEVGWLPSSAPSGAASGREPGIDPVARKVHIPIERAMKEYLAESEKTGGKL